jgi:hypothetical protein
MDRTTAAGIAITLAGFVGYVLGVLAPYPGRGLSLTGLMVGLTLVAVGDWTGTTGADHDVDSRDRRRDDGSTDTERRPTDRGEGRDATSGAGP